MSGTENDGYTSYESKDEFIQEKADDYEAEAEHTDIDDE